MPELPEVETYRRYVDAAALHQRIRSVTVGSERVLAGVDPGCLADRLSGRSFERTLRHGKYLGLNLSDGGTLVLHFGMSGRPVYYHDAAPPRFAHCIFHFADGAALAFACPRQFGRVRLVEDWPAFLRTQELGPDAYNDGLDATSLRRVLRGRKGLLKSFLLDQRNLAGVGNLYADELLFQLRVAPACRVDRLVDETVIALPRTLRRILRVAVERRARYDAFPRGYLLRHRFSDRQCPACGRTLETMTVTGRTTYFCPFCQKGS